METVCGEADLGASEALVCCEDCAPEAAPDDSGGLACRLRHRLPAAWEAVCANTQILRHAFPDLVPPEGAARAAPGG